MGWAQGAVAMEEVLGLVRGFVGVLVLAGGRTSSCAAATWSSDEVKKALRWRLFFEEELCFLGLISRRWNPLIEGFMSHTFGFIPVSKQYADLHQLLQGTSQDERQEKLLDSEEKDILEYARQLLQSKPYILWLLPPVLTAAAILPRSTLFEIYLAEIDKQFHEVAPVDRFRKCNCRGDGIEKHHNCEITERIQCLYTLHIR